LAARCDDFDGSPSRSLDRCVEVNESTVDALENDGGRLRSVRLGSGEALDRDALFFYVGWQLRNDVARTLG